MADRQDQLELASFLPRTLLMRLADQEQRGPPTDAEQLLCSDCLGAALFVDISGFASLTERFAQSGPAGAERLAELLSTFFSLLINIIDEQGGDIIDFSGDAILAFWAAPGESLVDAASAAAQCSMEILARADGYRAADDTTLRVKIGLGSGAGHRMQVGRIEQVMKFVLAGEAISEIGTTTNLASSGEAVLSRAMFESLGGGRAQALNDQHVRLVEFDRGRRQAAAPRLQTHYAQLQDYVARAVRSQFATGDTRWLSAFRTVSILFISLPSLHCQDESSRQLFKRAVLAVIDAVTPLEGDVLQILVDDKGPVLEVAFGLPPRAHEEDPVRAVRSGLEIAAALQASSIPFGIGIATGRAFCGPYGNFLRHHYAVVGTIVNLAARLMQRATDSVLCDDATRSAVEREEAQSYTAIEFVETASITAKGFSEPVAVHTPRITQADPISPRLLRTRKFVGRHVELKVFSALLDELAASAPVSIVVEGAAGVGKTMLMQEVIAHAGDRGIRVLRALPESIEANTPYFALRDLFADLVSTAETSTAAEISRLLETAGELAPLLNVVLPIELPNTPETQQLLGEVRADSTRKLLLRLLLERPDPRPLLIIVENLQWLDPVSWSVIRALSSHQSPFGLVLASRPLLDEAPPGFEVLRESATSKTLNLGTLAQEQIAELVADAIGAESVDDTVIELIAKRSEGHPLFARELALSLADAGLVDVIAGVGRLRSGSEDIGELVPDTLQGALISRLDRLSAPCQITVKLGSVVSRSFGSAILSGIHPGRESTEAVSTQLEELVTSDVLLREQIDAESIYNFLHVLIRDVAYAQLPFSQRREFHGRTARWIERNSTTADRRSLTLLAYHWQRAESFERCVVYLERAGEQALNDGAHSECITFFMRAIDVVDSTQGFVVDQSRRALWEQRIGEAHYSAGDIKQSEHWTVAALTRLNQKLPVSGPQWTWRVIRELLRQSWHLLRGAATTTKDSIDARKTVAAQAYSVLGEQLYFKNAPIEWLGITLTAINTAESAGRRDLAGRSYGGLGYAMGMGRIQRLARRYTQLGARTMTDVKARGIAYCAVGNWHIAFGRWEQADAALEPGMAMSRLASDNFSLGFALTIYGQGMDYRGDLARAKDIFAEEAAEAQSESNPLFLAWSHIDMAGSCLGLGELDAALNALRQADQYVWDVDAFSDIRYHGVRAGVHWMLGDVTVARTHAEAALERLRGKPQFHQSFYWTYTGIAHALVGMVGQQVAEGVRADKDLLALANEACANFRSLARIFPIMAARALRVSAMLDAHLGRNRSAVKRMRRALSLAERFRMPFDQALIHWECAQLGRRPDYRDKFAGVDHDAQARTLFAIVGAERYLKRLVQSQPG